MKRPTFRLPEQMSAERLQSVASADFSAQADLERLCMRNLLANAEERVFFKDRESRFMLVSEGWLAAEGHGRSLEEVIGKTDFDIFSQPHAVAAFEDERRVMRTGEPMVARLERETFRDRPDVWVSTIKAPLRGDDGTIVGTFGICRDVTAQIEAEEALARKADQALDASATKSAFLANMSHEIRTPMNGVIGLTELLLGTDLSDEQREYAEQVAQSGERILALVNDILDLSKIEAGHLELDDADFDLHETIKEACSAAGAQIRAKGLRLDMQIGSDVPRRVRGDSRRLHQVLVNLVGNAVKFTSDGAVTVRVSGTPRSQGSTLVRAEVADSGIGIDPASLERLFEPFAQADVATTRLYGGTGLGLAITRELVELMGGTINAESEPGRGSTFRIELELASPLCTETPAARDRDASAAPAASWPSPPLVLVAEDSPVNQTVAARTLERCGCRVEVVADGREALEALETQQFDAVLMDCQMPNMDGYQATAELRRREQDGRHTPVIAMTAHAMEGDRERCLAAGMDDYLSKPIRRADLADTLHRWIPSPADSPGVDLPSGSAVDAGTTVR